MLQNERNILEKYIQIIKKCYANIKIILAKVFFILKMFKMFVRARGTSNKSVNFLRLDAITSLTTVLMYV